MVLTFGKIVILTQIVSIVHYPNAIGRQKSKVLFQRATISQTRPLPMMWLQSLNCYFKAISAETQRAFVDSVMTRKRMKLIFSLRIRQITFQQIISVLIIFKITAIRLRDTCSKSIKRRQRMITRLNGSPTFSFSTRKCTSIRRVMPHSLMSNIQMSIFTSKW